MTGVYNPKTFILHAASLRQGCPHCEKFSTAATRRCLDRVSVPVWLVVLSDQLPVIALVGRYPNQLADRPRAHPEAAACATFSVVTTRPLATFGINPPFGGLSPTSGQVAHVLRTLAPLTTHCIATMNNPFDLHVLSTPPAFVLSQNQTLRKEFAPVSAKLTWKSLANHSCSTHLLTQPFDQARSAFEQSSFGL